jgi:glycosyltransferase involved in cell wall biosynthesis
VLADALVMPSFFEGWSLAITEAVLAGLPVIATDVGGAREQLRGTDGILLAPAREDLASLGCEPLVELLESPCDELVQRLGAALTAILERGGRRSRLPADADGLLREHAYTRYVEVFRWLVMGGDPASARFWTRPRPLPAGSSA